MTIMVRVCARSAYFVLMSTSSYHDLRVWQHAIELALSVYRATETFPKHEVYGLAQQMRRAAVSVASNIAEGKGRIPTKNSGNFYSTRGVRFLNSRPNVSLLES